MEEIEFLGTGTSTGVPQIGCNCEVCTSTDSRDKRFRASAIIRAKGENILIDCGPDFRLQMIRANSPKLSALLITHQHYDHVGGLDDLRPYTYTKSFPIYCKNSVIVDIKNRLPYCFADKLYPGVPILNLIEVNSEPFYIGKVKVEPLPVMHHKLSILGYLIGKIAYITDANYLCDEVIERLKNIPLLVINSLRPEPHISHYSLPETLEVIEKIKPKEAYLIHMADKMGLHAKVSEKLPKNVHLAHDGLVVKVH